MKIITTKNKSKYGLMLGVYHSVILQGDTIYSFEGLHTFAKRKVVKYTRNEYFQKHSEIVSTIEADDIDMSKYENMTGYKLCHEWIVFIFACENRENPFDKMTYGELTENAYTSLKKFIYYILYLGIMAIITLSIVVYKNNTISKLEKEVSELKTENSKWDYLEPHLDFIRKNTNSQIIYE